MFLRGDRRATWVPLFPTLLAVPFIAAGIFMLVLPTLDGYVPPPTDDSAAQLQTVAVFLGVGVVILAYGAFKIRRFTRVGDAVFVRGILKRLELRPSIAAGYTIRGGSRYANIFIYFVDGTTQFDVITMLPYRPKRAAQIAKQLEETLGLTPTTAATARAAQDHDALVSAQAQVDAYYQSPTYKRTIWYLCIGVLLYVVIMGIVTSR